ncbi:hypothetical protein Tco_0368532 [Tanacetum coccineum]
MDDEPMWVADCVVAPTLGSAITIPETANEFAIKGNHLNLVKGKQFDGRIKTDPHKHIHEFLRIYDMFKYRDTKNEVVRLMMFPLSLTDEAKTWIFPSAYCEEVHLTFVDDDGNPLVPTGFVESNSEVKVVFDETASLRISRSGKDGGYKCYGTNSLLEQWMNSYPDNDDYDPYDDGRIMICSSTFSLFVIILISRSLPSNTQPNPKGSISKPYQPPQARNEHVNAVFTRSGKSYDPPINPNDQQNGSETPINFDSENEDEEPTPQSKSETPKPIKETLIPKPYKPKIRYP